MLYRGWIINTKNPVDIIKKVTTTKTARGNHRWTWLTQHYMLHLFLHCINSICFAWQSCTARKRVMVCERVKEDAWWDCLRCSNRSLLSVLSEVPLPCNPTLLNIWLKCDPVVPTQNVAGPEGKSSLTASPGLRGELQSVVISLI